MQILKRWKVSLLVIGAYLAITARCQADLPACEVSKAQPQFSRCIISTRSF